jgi:phosphate transport system permease protein
MSTNEISETTIEGIELKRVGIKAFLWFSTIVSAVGIILGLLSLASNSLEAYPVWILGLQGICLFLTMIYVRSASRTLPWRLLALFILSTVEAVILKLLPLHIYGLQFDAVIHRSVVSAIFLLSISIPSFGAIFYYLMGATPHADDLAHYPLIIVPLILSMTSFLVIVYLILKEAIPNLSWSILITAFHSWNWQTVVWQNNWPQWVSHTDQAVGILNYLLGTLLLMGLTSLISLPIGMAVGIYITEYSNGLFARILKFACDALRSISVFIIGITAVSIVSYSSGSFLSRYFYGYYHDLAGQFHLGNGSFIVAAAVISMLVIPLIARATEEGIRSLPQEMKEGSLALGTSKRYTLSHIVIPWSLPNVTTGLLLGCAEAAGSLATIWFIAGSGDYGVGPFKPVTSLSYFIFLSNGETNLGFKKIEGNYQFVAALLLILITIGLSISVVILKRKLHKRYREA